MYKALLLFIASTFISLASFAQSGSVRGYINDKANGEPLAFVTVYLDGTEIGAVTDISGFYSISGIKPGNYKLVATFIGYDSAFVDIELKEGQVLNKVLQIGESAIVTETVEVSAEKEAYKNEARVSVTTITPKQINRLPSIGGTPDLAQYLQVIPGIIFTGDQGGQLYVRGGSPIMNKVILDGMTIWNPFHSIGFYSVFETDIIRSVDVYTGGFGAEYGGRTSAIIDIKTRAGNSKTICGKVEASPFVAKALIEGPIAKMKNENNGLTFMLTAKHSYLKEAGPALYPYVKDFVYPGDTSLNKKSLPFSFTDIFGKISFNAANGSRVGVYGFNFADKTTFDGVTDFTWNSTGVGTSFSFIPGGSKIIMGGHLNYSNYRTEYTGRGEQTRYSSIGGFNAAMDVKTHGIRTEFQAGLEVNGFSTNFSYYNTNLGYTYRNEDNNTEINVFARLRAKLGRLVVEPGIRMQYYASLGNFAFEPRLAAKLNITDKLRFKFASGYYTQNLISAVNERDIFNFFQGFLVPADGLISVNGTEATTSNKLQSSVHVIGGFEIDVTKKLVLNIEPYWKGFPQVINFNREKKEVQDPDFATETGAAYGCDLSAKFNAKNLYVFLGYSLAWVTRNDGKVDYATHFDRRHNMNLLITYDLGGKGKKYKPWELSLRWNLGSGFPFTRTQGFYPGFGFPDGINSNYQGGSQDLGVFYSDTRNDGRLPYYHRLDFSVKRIFEFSKRSKLEITLGVTNSYNRENVFYFDRVSYSRVNQLPLIPTLAVGFSF